MDVSRNTSAALLALTASAVLSFIDNFVHAVSEEAGLWQFQLIRALMALPLLIVGARVSGLSLRPVNPYRLAGRSLAVSTGLLIYFAALGNLSVAQAAAGLFSAPIWVVLLSVFMFRKRIGVKLILCVLFGFSGALLILQPDIFKLTVFEFFPLAAGLFYGLGMLLTKHWCTDENPVALALGIFVVMGIVGLVILTIVTIFPIDSSNASFITQPWVKPTPKFLWLTLFQAVGAVIAISLIAQAYKTGQPEFIAVVEYSFLIFAIFWAWLLWGSITNTLAWIGVAIVIFAGLTMSMQSRETEST